MKIYKIGIIGFGGFGQFLKHCWSANRKITVQAIADLNQPTTNDETITWYSDWQDLLKDRSIDIVVIATPPATHAEIALAAIECNKHIILEKPMATSTAEAQKIAVLHKQSDRILVVDFMLRFHPFAQLIKDWVLKRSFGRLRRVLIENYAQDECLPVSHWFWDKNQSGGILIEHGVHFIDLVNFITEAIPIDITGVKFDRSPQQEDQVLANVCYNNGIIATHYHDFSRPGFFESTTMKFIFDLAEIETYGWIPLSGNVKALVSEQTASILEKLPGYTIADNQPIEAIIDISRPAGWGISDNAPANEKKSITSGGAKYSVTHQITGSFKLAQTKQAIYCQLVNAVLDNVIAGIENHSVLPFITLDEAILSIKIAEAALK